MPRRNSSPFCSIVDCGKPVKGLGLCNNHYHRWKKYGRTEKLPKRVTRRDHPLYILWWDRKRGNALSPEWLDFDTFVRDIGEKPGPNFLLMRKFEGPFSPENFQWIEHLKRKEGESNKDWWARKWKARMAANPGIERKRMYARKYGMTVEQYENMFKEQNGKCAICEEEETSFCGRSGSRKTLCVDHCHQTGKVRGLLCIRCNTALGKIEQAPHILRLMWDYLHKHAA